MKRSGVLPTSQFAYRNGLGTRDALYVWPICFKEHSKVGKRRIVQIDCSADFDRVNHCGILYKLGSVGIGGSVLSLLRQFLSNRSQHVQVNGCLRKLVNMVSEAL